MNDINGALEPTHESFFFNFEPKSSILSQNLNLLKPTNITLERGVRYRAYAELRESNIRKKQKLQQQQQEKVEELVLKEPVLTLTPPQRKRVTFQGGGGGGVSGGRNGLMSSVVTKSVPDFSSVLRKENRKPVSTFDLTPPPSKNSSLSKLSRLGGSKSAGGCDKGYGSGGGGGKGVMGRKSYASLEELKGLSSGVYSAINGESKGVGGVGKSYRGTQKTVLGYRQY
ncbi:homeobox Hox-B3-like protein [Thalictrum thalictroides]|uniref:Homeobox Hox-B3-like protein n=1 Tax=Thalictrum thalictroides TaxID=46969 RepID=A0A7J6X1H8_THATH|nr:homeobox Hox-B3-like protein [Thalictrum thalictroides]